MKPIVMQWCSDFLMSAAWARLARHWARVKMLPRSACIARWRGCGCSFIRRSTRDEETAKDSTQGFFEQFLEKNYVSHVDREKGKFRSFARRSSLSRA